MYEWQRTLTTDGPEVTAKFTVSFNELGETPLLVAIKAKHLHVDVAKYLVKEFQDGVIIQNGQFFWKQQYYYDIPPIFIAKEDDQPAIGLTSIMASFNTRLDKINGLKLIGTVFILHGSEAAYRFGFPRWLQATRFREPTHEAESTIAKRPNDNRHGARRAIGSDLMEFETMEQLNHTPAFQPNYGYLILQAFLVNQCILTQISLISELLAAHWQDFAMKNWYQGQYGRVVTISLIVLELFQANQWCSDEYLQANGIVNRTLIDILVDSFRMLQREIGSEGLSFTNLKAALSYTCYRPCYRLQIELQDVDINYVPDEKLTIEVTANHNLEIIMILAEMLPQLTRKESQEFKECLKDYISRDDRCGFKQQSIQRKLRTFSGVSENVVRLLLEVGAAPNVVDLNGDTALEQANHCGKSVVEYLKSSKFNQNSDSELQSMIDVVFPLDCCSARVIRQHRIDL